MGKLRRPLTEEDLKDKGFPFGCENCGNKPIPQDIVALKGECAICGESITAYTIDTAEYIIKLSA